MAVRIYEIIQDGKHLHRYMIWRKGAFQGWLIGESPETICRQHGWQIEECRFEKEAFSLWDMGEATAVKEVE